MIDAPTLTDRLTDITHGDPDTEFTGDEQAVRDWLAEQPTAEYATAAREEIDGRPVALDEEINGHSLQEIIRSHNDDPDAYEAGYVIDAGKTIVQYRHRDASEKPPIKSDEAADALASHIDALVARAVWAEVLPDARAKFLAEA